MTYREKLFLSIMALASVVLIIIGLFQMVPE